MKKIFIFCIFLTQINALGQSSVLIEPNGSNGILSKSATTITTPTNAVSLGATGPGTRLMWIPLKSAFRVGTVNSNYWDADSIGTWSFASGYNTQAIGLGSLSMGLGTVARGMASTSLGLSSVAKADYSISMGYQTLASGGSSTSMGYNTIASGQFTTSMGYNTIAQPLFSVAMGYNNLISGETSLPIPTDPLLIIGNGANENNRNNALTLLKNSNLGLNTATPKYQLTFKDDLGDKISLYGGNLTNTTNHYGLGIQSAKLQIFTPSDVDDVVFGYGRSAAFTENVRLKGTGLVGIGVSTPSELLDVNGRMRVRHRPGNTAGVWMSNDLNSTAVGDGAFYGLKSNTEAGIFIGGAWRFGVTSTGNMTVGGTVTASCGVLVCSDLRYKKNISSLNNSLDNILKINGVRYDFKKEEFPERNFTDKNQIGFIAQEIEKIFPEMVFTDEKGYKSVDYARLTPVLVEALKELNIEYNELKTKNGKLETRLDKIEAMLNK